jgi:hypothetical protein
MLVAFIVPTKISQAQDYSILLMPLLKAGVDAIGGALIDKAFEPSTEKYQVGKYEIRFSEETFRNKPCYLFNAYSNDKQATYVYYEKDDPKDVKEIEGFKKMSEIEKKVFIKNAFLKYSNFDLGPIEEPVIKAEVPAEKETAKAPASTPQENAAASKN